MSARSIPPPASAQAQDDHDRQVREAVATLVFDRSRSSNLLGGPVAFLIVWLLWGAVPATELLVWLAAKCGALAWRVAVTARHDRDGPGRAPYWERHFFFALAADGAVYGLLGTWLLPRDQPVLEVVLVATLLGIASVALVVLAASLRASLALTVPVLLPAMVVQLLHGDKVSLFLGAGMAVFLVLVYVEGRRASAHTAAMLRLKFRADELAAQRQAALAQAEQSSAVKGRFLATMSHEMRTPLHGILGLAAMVQQDATCSPALREERLRTLQQTGEHLLALINDVLDYSRIEGGHLKLRPQDFDLHATLRACAALARVQADDNGLALRVELALPSPCPVHGDEARLRQVVVNLLGNAVKFTPAGHVRLDARWLDDGRLHLEVADTGPGVPEQARERVFEAFEQLDGSFARRHGGTGLGLSISLELVRAMRGSLTCDRAPEGGALFTMTLPLPPATSPLQASRAAENASLPASGHLRGRVLLAEDNPVNALVAEAALERLGLVVQVVTDGHDALNELQQIPGRHDLVLMDCQMPGLDGFEATRRFRAWEQAQGRPRLPVVALTANALEGDRRRSLDAGMDEHLPKPYSLQELHAVLSQYLPSAQAEAAPPV
jgi:signal transduction histidine kinase/ActR/RegA family two-component response regulator